jgi:hypothetical protein
MLEAISQKEYEKGGNYGLTMIEWLASISSAIKDYILKQNVTIFSIVRRKKEAVPCSVIGADPASFKLHQNNNLTYFILKLRFRGSKTFCNIAIIVCKLLAGLPIKHCQPKSGLNIKNCKLFSGRDMGCDRQIAVYQYSATGVYQL